MKNICKKTLVIGIILLFVGVSISSAISIDTRPSKKDNEPFLTTNKHNRQYWKTIIFLPFFGIIDDLTEDNGYYTFYGRIIIGLGFVWSSLNGFSLYPEFGINSGCEIPIADFHGTINENYIIGFLFNISYYEFPIIKF